MGDDMSVTRAAAEPIQAILTAFRQRGFRIVPTCEGRR
jgi:hypothetical protein